MTRASATATPPLSPPPSPSPATQLSVRIVSLDYYLAPPVAPFDVALSPLTCRPLREVPVVRVFGATPAGQKCCLHLHRQFPYFFLRYPDDESLAPDDVARWCAALAAGINSAVNSGTRPDTPRAAGHEAGQQSDRPRQQPQQPAEGAAPASGATDQRGRWQQGREHVFNVSLVRALPYYGYQEGTRVWAKIHLLNPGLMTRVVNLLRTGAIMGRVWQPFEAHVPYLLQLFLDNSLYGMGFVTVNRCMFRQPLPEDHTLVWNGRPLDLSHMQHAATPSAGSSTAATRRWLVSSTPADMLQAYTVQRMTTCALEADALVADVANRRDVIVDPDVALHRTDTRLVQSLRTLWDDEAARRGPCRCVTPPRPLSPRPHPQPDAQVRRLRSQLEDIVEQDAADAAGGLETSSAVAVLAAGLGSTPSQGSRVDAEALAALEQLEAQARLSSDLLSPVGPPLASASASTTPQHTQRSAPSPLLSVADTDDDDDGDDNDNDDEGEDEIVDDNSDESNEDDAEDFVIAATAAPQHKTPATRPRVDPVIPATSRGHKTPTARRRSRVGAEARAILQSQAIEFDSLFRPPSRVLDTPVSMASVSGASDSDDDVVASSQPDVVSATAMDRVPRRLFPEDEEDDQDVVSASYTGDADDDDDDDDAEVDIVPATAIPASPTPLAMDTEPPLSSSFAPVRLASAGQVQQRARRTTPIQPTALRSQVPATPLPSRARRSLLQPGVPPAANPAALVAETPLAAPAARVWTMALPPPSQHLLLASLADHSVPDVVHPVPFFSNPADAPERPRVFAGVEFRIPVAGSVAHLADFVPPLPQPHRHPSLGSGGAAPTLPDFPPGVFEFAQAPPPRHVITAWLQQQTPAAAARAPSPLPSLQQRPPQGLANGALAKAVVAPAITGGSTRKPGGVRAIRDAFLVPRAQPLNLRQVSQIEEPPGAAVHAHAISPLMPPQQPATQPSSGVDATVATLHGSDFHRNQHLTMLCIEVIAEARGDLRPDPKQDAVLAVVFTLVDSDAVAVLDTQYRPLRGAIVLERATDAFTGASIGVPYRVQRVADEPALVQELIDLVHTFDPDLLVGWEIQLASWGYLIERAAVILNDANLCSRLSRTAVGASASVRDPLPDEWGAAHSSGIRVTGRIVLNVWRLMRSELKLQSYTLQSVVFHALHRRVPEVAPRVLADWACDVAQRWRALRHVMAVVTATLDLLEHLDVVGRTSELARVFGIDFFSVLSRGSQYRVESIMLRLTKPKNYMLLSPSAQQVADMNAPEAIPLVMEPESRFYQDPVLVLDFQSLYPSIVIAYNLCFSTCLGRLGGADIKRFGAYFLDVPTGQLSRIGADNILVTPNKVMFVRAQHRSGILPRMLLEILQTRVMVKKAMALAKDADPVLHRMLHARQMGLKMIANVTYGYTSANFSGRMPAIDIADSIVQLARETLERAIRTIESTPRWGAHVVYGDTDSVFVRLQGCSRDRAFAIGADIAETITRMNPAPVELKFEKVYHPCLLVTKKRYVGYRWDSPSQREPVLDAKGIETVRRDSCAAVRKVMQSVLHLLFRQTDLSLVRELIYRTCTKVLQDRVSLGDFIFAKEVRLGTYSARLPPPPAALVGTKRMSVDPRAAPLYGERVPYVVVYGTPNARLIDLVVAPSQVLADPQLKLHGIYYITKVILPALDRVLSLVGVDVHRWFAEMPRPARSYKHAALVTAGSRQGPRATIDQYYLSRSCPLCGTMTKHGLCDGCAADQAGSGAALLIQVATMQRDLATLLAMCRTCSGQPHGQIACVSLDCPVYFQRVKARQQLCNRESYLALIQDW